jgi:hypothetical protein
LQYSADGREVSFEIDATSFQPGNGTLEIKTYGGDNQPSQFNQSPTSGQSGNNLTIKLYPAPPVIADIKARRGDREVLITGDRLEQISSLNINGRRAIIKGNGSQGANGNGNMGATTGVGGYGNTSPTANQFPNQTQFPAQNAYQTQLPNQSQMPVTPNTQNPASLVTAPSPYQNIGSNQRMAVFEDTTTRINADTISLELNLEDNRYYQYPNRFPVGASRPAIKVNEQNEIEGIFLSQSLNNQTLNIQNDQVMVTPLTAQPKNKRQRTTDQGLQNQLDLSSYPVVSIDKQAMTVAVQNILTDYNFRLENLSIETRIEDAMTSSNQLPRVIFDVLDTNNLRLNFTFNQSINKNLSGRRLQFRIRDRERGDSDWLTIKQTFVRIPIIESVKCTNEVNNQCELRGEGLDYIAQVSTDGGRSWSNTLQVQPTADGNLMMLIPNLINQKFLQIKLRDYPKTEGLAVFNFAFSNTVKVAKTKPTQTNNPNQPLNQLNGNQTDQNVNPVTNNTNIKPNLPSKTQPQTGKSKGKPKI